MDVWVPSSDDIEEGVSIAAGRFPFMDVESTLRWARHYINHPKVSFIRTKNVVTCVSYNTLFWEPDKKIASMLFIAGRPEAGVWEAYRLIKAQIARAKENGCSTFELGSITGLDMKPFAKRLGLENVGPNYCVRL